MPETATQNVGVAARRSEAMADITKNRHAEIDRELKDGGTAEGIAALEPGEHQAKTVKPDGVDQGEWDKLDDTAKAGLAEAEAERVKAEAGETDEQKAARVEQEEAARKETERKAAEAAAPKVKIKVDGEEREVTAEQIREAGIRALQKESAGDKRLEEASRLFKEATAAIEKARAGGVQDPNQGGARLPQAGGAAADVLTDQAFTDAVKKIQYGSEAEAAATLKDLITRAARTGQTEQLTLDRVAEMLDFREATRWAHDEYKEILGDPKLKALFSTEEKRLRAAGDMRPYRELYSDIGDGLREWLKGMKPAEQAQPASSRQNRQERKSSVVVIPSAAARREAPPQPKEPTPTETIDKMRAARRQA